MIYHRAAGKSCSKDYQDYQIYPPIKQKTHGIYHLAIHIYSGVS